MISECICVPINKTVFDPSSAYVLNDELGGVIKVRGYASSVTIGCSVELSVVWYAYCFELLGCVGRDRWKNCTPLRLRQGAQTSFEF